VGARASAVAEKPNAGLDKFARRCGRFATEARPEFLRPVDHGASPEVPDAESVTVILRRGKDATIWRVAGVGSLMGEASHDDRHEDLVANSHEHLILYKLFVPVEQEQSMRDAYRGVDARGLDPLR